MFTAAVVCLAIVGWGIYGLRQIVDRGYLDQVEYAFRDASMLPGESFQRSALESTVRIYFTRDGKTLTPSTRRLRRSVTGAERIGLILQGLFEIAPNPPLRSAFPPGTEARGFYRIDRTGYLDLSKEFLNPREPSPRGERLAVYAIVNSIVLNDPEIDSVQLMVEGEPIETAWGWIDCSSPLGANLAMIR